MFSCEVFNKQDEIYKKSILPTDIIKISIEAGSDIGWYKYVDYCYGINSFGESGHLKELISKFNFTKENIIEFIKTIS